MITFVSTIFTTENYSHQRNFVELNKEFSNFEIFSSFELCWLSGRSRLIRCSLPVGKKSKNFKIHNYR